MESEDKTEPVEEMDSDQPMDSEDKTEPFEEVDTDQTLDSEDKAEPVEEVDMDQTVDSEEKTEPVEEVDIDQTVDSEDKAEPVEEVDADQPIEAEKLVEEVDLDEPVDSEDKTEPVEVSTDQTVDSEDKTEPVEEVDTDQPEDSEDKTEPVEEADKDEPVDSEQVEDVLPEADETAPEDSQEMPLQEEISSTESPSSDMICDKSGKDVPAPECIEECICTESDELLDKDKIPPTELPASDVVRDKPDEGEVSEDSQEMPIQEKISSTESPSSDMVCDKSGKDVPAPECIEECICTESDELLDKDNIPPTELPASDVVCDKPDEGQVAGDSQEMLLQEKIPSTEPPTSDVAYDKPAEGDKNDLKDETDGIDVHRLERVSSSTTQIADEFPLQDKQPYRLEKVTSSLRECAFEFGSFKEGENVPYIEGTKDTTEQVKMEEGQDGSVAPESGANDVQETGDLSEEGSPTAPEVTAEDAEETEDGSEQVSPIDHESSVDDLKETDGGEEVSPIIPESGTDETNEREGVSEKAVIAPVGGVDESKETPEEICSISFETGGEQEIPEKNIVDENTVDVQEQILEPSKPKGDEIVEKPETTDEVIVHEKADGGIEEKAEIIGKEICTCSDSVEELYKKESEFTEETPTITSSPDDAIISECGTEDTDLEGKESKEDFEIDKRIESEKAFLEEEPTVQPGDSVEVMVVNHVDSKEEFIKDDSEKLDETEISYDGDTESEASDMEQSRDAQPKTNATNDFETVFKKDVIEDINLICKCSDISLTDYSPSSVENDDSEYDTALSCPDHDELFTEESYPSDTEPTPKEEYVEDIDIDVVVEKGGGGKSYSWDKGSYDAVNFEGEILFSSMAPHETTSEDSAARVSIDSVLEADDEGQETAYEVDQQVMFHYEGVRDILVQKVPKESKGSVFIPATPSKVQHDPILQQIQPMTRVSEDNQGESIIFEHTLSIQVLSL
ncbi:uncharacterized protein [Anabrus simplex]|uniref:uncharacterized protein n=1 Tax=Anabrus simplex TaxID=316456 RepID=UPI0035A27454